MRPSLKVSRTVGMHIYSFSFYRTSVRNNSPENRSDPHSEGSVLWRRWTGVGHYREREMLPHLLRSVWEFKYFTIGGVRMGLCACVRAVLGSQFYIYQPLHQRLNGRCNFADSHQISLFRRFKMSFIVDFWNLVRLVSAGTTDTGMKTTLWSQRLICTNVFMFAKTPRSSKGWLSLPGLCLALIWCR